MRTNDADTMNSPFAIRDDFHKTLGPTLGLGTIVLGEGPAQDTDLSTQSIFRFRFRQADIGEFGVRISYPWNSPVGRLRRQLEKRIANNDACVIPGNMGKLQRPCDIANGKDPLVRGPQPRIYLDTSR